MSYISPPNPPILGNFKTEVIAFHGWGFDRQCWKFWQEQFTQLGCKFQAFDRGYFGNSLQPSFTNFDSKKIILVHSYGLHLCPIELLQQADLLIAFNSFLTFHPEARVEKRRSQLVLGEMIRQFQTMPEIVLQNFYHHSGYPQLQHDFNHINHLLLLQDLHQLNDSKLDASCMQSIAKLLVFSSSDDRIVAASQTQEFLIALPHSCELIRILRAGHALPFTHFAECWSILQSVLCFSINF